MPVTTIFCVPTMMVGGVLGGAVGGGDGGGLSGDGGGESESGWVGGK